MTVTKSCSLSLEKKMLSVYSSPADTENLLASAANETTGNRSEMPSQLTAIVFAHLLEIFEGFFVQSMPLHLPVERLIVDLRFFSGG